jgi:hypothetical protein
MNKNSRQEWIMSLGKWIATCLVLLSLLGGWFSASSQAQGPCVGGMCRHGIPRSRCLEVGCSPRSAFYNYYPTTWRRWPTDTNAAAQPTPAAPPATEPAPGTTPPSESGTGPQIQPEEGQPQITEEDATAPGETAPGSTAPEPAPPLPADEEMLPFSDTAAPPTTQPSPGGPPSQPAPPSDQAPPGQDAPPMLPSDSITDPGLPGLPPSTTPSIPEDPPGGSLDPMEDAPPTMPDDPFKDDPVQPPATPTSPTGRRERSEPALSNKPAGEKSWRAAEAAAEPGVLRMPEVAKSLVPEETRIAPSLLASYPSTERVEVRPAAALQETSPAEEGGPRLLPPVDEPGAEPRSIEPSDGAPARQNPLRTARVAAPTQAVVPTAAWSTAETKPASATGQARRNPLRGN